MGKVRAAGITRGLTPEPLGRINCAVADMHHEARKPLSQDGRPHGQNL